MKKMIAAAVLCSAVFPAAQAQDQLFTRPGWMVGAQASSYQYHEPNMNGGGPDFAKLTGNMGGLLGSYTWTNSSHVWSTIDLREAYGRLKYEGSGTLNDVPNTIIEGRAVVGMDFLAGSSLSFSPYVGLGYRYLYDDNRGYSSSNSVGYRRSSNYVYAPVGLTMRFDMGSRWVLAPTLEYDVFLQGRQTSDLADTDIPGLMNVTNDQSKGYGYRGYLMLEKDHWAFGVWTHYWSIKESDIVGISTIDPTLGGQEPKNWTRESGIELRYRF